MRLRSHRQVPVVIVGAGPTGITAANMLGQRGITCLVVERHRDIYPLPRTVHFDDEVFRILQSIGLAEEVRAITRPMLGLQLLDADHRPFARFHRDPEGGMHGYPEANTFEQPALEEVLRAGLTRFPHVELRCGAEVVAVEAGRTDGPAPVRVTVRDSHSGQLEEVWTQAVLGCDGANSRTRAIVDTTMEDLRFTQSWLLVDARSPEPLKNWDGVHQVCDPSGAVTYMRVGPQRYRWQFQLRDTETEHNAAEAEVVRQRIAPWLVGVDPQQVTIVRQTVFKFRGIVARRWHRDRVFLLGDAAHQAPPFLGQGMCAGMRDAANLTWKLALVLQGYADERLLDSYEAERRPHVRRMVQLAVRQGWLMTGGRIRMAAVRAVLGQAASLPAVNQRMGRSMCPPLRPGPFVRPTSRLLPGRPRLAGKLCPQPTVTTTAGAEVPLDDVLGDGFAVLARGTEGIATLDEDMVRYFNRLNTRYIGIISRGSPPPRWTAGELVVVHDTHGVLSHWLTQGCAAAVLLRPDRTVLVAGPNVDLAGWRRGLESSGLQGGLEVADLETSRAG